MKNATLPFSLLLGLLVYLAIPDPKEKVIAETPLDTSTPDSTEIFLDSESIEAISLGFEEITKHSTSWLDRTLDGLRQLLGVEKNTPAPNENFGAGKTYEQALRIANDAWSAKEVAEKFIELGKYDEKIYKYLVYCEKYKTLAINQYLEYGIPVSVTLGQGLLESNAGESALAQKANNHFGIKRGSSWSGNVFAAKDDEYDKHGKKINSYFRVYSSAEEGFDAHSKFLLGERYRWMRESFSAFDETYPAHPDWLGKSEVNAFEAWCVGLKASGYATASHYHRSLYRLVASLELYKIDVALYRYVKS